MSHAEPLRHQLRITANSAYRRLCAAAHSRRRFDGLLAEARLLGADPYAGDCVVFVKRDFKQLRAIVGDPIGLYLISRRFEGGRLRRFLEFAKDPAAKSISKAELSMLLEGANYTVHTRAPAWRTANT